MKRLQTISGIVIMVFAAVVYFEGRRLPFGTLRNPGPGFLPLGFGIVLFFTAMLFVLGTVFKKGGPGDPMGAPWKGLQWKKVPYTLAALTVYALLVDRIGFIICTASLMAALLWGSGARRRLMAVIAGSAVAIASYVLFRSLLGVQLPPGLLRL